MSVSASRRVVRLMRRAPRCSSRSATSRVTTAGERFISRAAAAKLPESMTRQNTRIECKRSMTNSWATRGYCFAYGNGALNLTLFIDCHAVPTVHPIVNSPPKESTMNAKHLLAAVAVTLAGSSAMAFEATEFVDAPSTLSRAGIAAVQAAGPTQAPSAVVVSRGEATQFADVPAVVRDRSDGSY